LEDFVRLHISGVPTLPQDCTATLSWDGSGALRLYNAYEADGGIGYLTNESTASFQSAFVNTSGGAEGFGAAIALLSSVGTHTFSTTDFHNGLPRHFLFEGLQAGSGELILTIERGQQQIARASVFIEMVPITDMYERAYVTGIQQTHPAMRDNTNASTFGVEQRLPVQPGETDQVVVYVHGFRNDYGQFKNYAETLFKRLYWQGYRGRFAGINWPTRMSLLEYNPSEYIGFRTAAGAAGFFTELRSRFPDHSINVAAHSMGNIVMMETLKLHMAAGRQDIDNYVLMEAAVPAQCYDANVPTHSPLLAAELLYTTPNTYQLYPGSIQNALRGEMSNFFSELDRALGSWVINQVVLKPDNHYGFTNSTPYFSRNSSQHEIVSDPREVMTFVARPRTKTIGAQDGMAGIVTGNAFNLEAELGFGNSVPDHSGQFTRSIQSVRGFYVELLQRFFP
jgi:pimeloyl-ACP methyl ester carboxylesterase